MPIKDFLFFNGERMALAINGSGTQQILSRDNFREDLAVLSGIKLGHPDSKDAALEVLTALKEYGVRYVDAIITYSAKPIGNNALAIFDARKAISSLIERALTLNHAEPAFRNQAPIAQSRDLIKAYATPYVGAPLNGIFATFAGSAHFQDYLRFEHGFEASGYGTKAEDPLTKASFPKTKVRSGAKKPV